MKWQWWKKKEEVRADPVPEKTVEEIILEALGMGGGITKKTAMEIPTVSGCVEKLAGTVCRLPIKLYKKVDGKVEEVLDDPRLKLLNDDTGDTLNSGEFWHSMIEDYFLGKGGFAYINRRKGAFESLHYVREEDVSVVSNLDPIFKDYDILVLGERYYPHDFLKIKRKTKDGAESIPLQKEYGLIMAVAYASLLFEETLVKRGGNKRGFIESEGKLGEDAITAIKNAWRNLYSNNTENVVVLNKGVSFKESSNTSVEMQLNENKKSNAEELCKLFGFSVRILTGGATAEDRKEFINAVVRILADIEAALDRDLLLEKEKGVYYFAFDTKEITRGSQEERYKAYGEALKSNFLQIDEVRAMEDMSPLGFNYIKLGLNDVLLDPVSGVIYTPNTNATADLGSMKGLANLRGGEKDED
ncbi:phage portal protein [Anaerotignum sp. MB30-C6]|uniref:phage portal protein n=1 Tax=Anaerotignum sp. MB30-C6 TaxID=3070814 RepID=UPI0027DADF9A|nr:phage portal protein [Anaerotignum sp. MB30-C6]WMI81589.1 phage portal protein [Anaerotignum sp. MB30-C6]